MVVEGEVEEEGGLADVANRIDGLVSLGRLFLAL